MSEADRYTLLGALFGVSFPIGSFLFLHFVEAHDHEFGPAAIAACVAEAHGRHSLLFVIDSAPLFLGLFARFAGIRQDRILVLMGGLEREVAEKTESLRVALLEAQTANETILRLACHDGLTGIWNRRRMEEELRRWVSHAARYGHRMSLLYIDFDHFKRVNDQYGHAAGDDYLKRVSTLLAESFRSTDCLGRWGGDEFVVLLPEAGETEAVTVTSKMIARFRHAVFEVNGDKLPISASIGIALFPQDAGEEGELVRRADQAMYAAKKAGGGCLRLYTHIRQSSGDA